MNRFTVYWGGRRGAGVWQGNPNLTETSFISYILRDYFFFWREERVFLLKFFFLKTTSLYSLGFLLCPVLGDDRKIGEKRNDEK